MTTTQTNKQASKQTNKQAEKTTKTNYKAIKRVEV